MHNGRMRLTTSLIALGLAASTALSACSGEDQGETAPEPQSQPTATPSPSETPYLDVPEEVELTSQGSELGVGETATVAYEPRQGMVGALDIKVTAMEKASFKQFEGWELTKQTRKATPYFVRAKVTNVGDTNLRGRPVPLYIVDGENRLIESSVFTGSFEPCEGSMLPKPFRNGDSTKACLVYLAPDKGDLTAVSFRPTQEFNPVTWTGELETSGSGRGGKNTQGNKNSSGNDNGGNGNGNSG